MRFKPVQQLNTILEQEHLEPTISWAVRVVLALNVPLLLFPLVVGFSYHIIWAAFGAYMLTLIDYRGSHYRKMLIQLIEAVFIFIAALIGMNIGNSILLSVLGMMVIGIFAALIRNWSDYGSTIGIGVGFFYLFGISNPTDSFQESLPFGWYILLGSLWAIAIVFFSFPFTASNPLRRSVATIWKKNTDYLDAIILSFLQDEQQLTELELTEKELLIRKSIDNSIELFERRKQNSRLNAVHYDQMLDIRKTSSQFAASLKVLHEDLLVYSAETNQPQTTLLYKSLSALSQASARLSILIFTFRAEDLTMAKIRIKRFKTSVEILRAEQAVNPTKLNRIIDHLEQSLEYLSESLTLIDAKLNFQKSDYFENYKLSLNHFIAGLKPRLMRDRAFEMFNFNSQQFNYALRVALGLGLSVWIFKYFRIDHGHWIALTMLIVIQPYYGATRKKGIERSIGTMAGILVGGMILLLPVPREVFFGVLVVISFLVAYFLRNNYKVGVFFVTIMMVVMMQISQQGSWELIGWRLISTVIGVLIAIAATLTFWPIWEKQRFPHLFKKAMYHNLFFFQTVLQTTENGRTPENWHKIRRLAEAANHDLFACVQRMYEEPKRLQYKVERYFTQVGASLRITREITAIAQNRDKEPQLDWSQNINVQIQNIESFFNTLEKGNESSLDGLSLSKTVHSHPKEALHVIQEDLGKIEFELITILRLKAIENDPN